MAQRSSGSLPRPVYSCLTMLGVELPFRFELTPCPLPQRTAGLSSDVGSTGKHGANEPGA